MTRREAQPTCPLCGARSEFAHRDERRPYHRCRRCLLIFVPAAFHLSPEEERRRYDLHENDPGDPAYRAFLGRLAEPMMARLEAGAHGLDYGSGPGPTLSRLFSERGFPTVEYDPQYANDPTALEARYDFVACSETVEHFRHPARDFAQMAALLCPEGLLGIMTQPADGIDFARWHYLRDETHICFYSQVTFALIAERLDLALEHPAPAIFLLRAPTGERS